MHHILSNYPLRLNVIMPGDTIEFYGYIRPFNCGKVDQGTKPQIVAMEDIAISKEGTQQKPKPKNTLDNPDWKG